MRLSKSSDLLRALNYQLATTEINTKLDTDGDFFFFPEWFYSETPAFMPFVMHFTRSCDDIWQLVCIFPTSDLMLFSSTLAPHR